MRHPITRAAIGVMLAVLAFLAGAFVIAPAAANANTSCHPAYTPCVPIRKDVDCKDLGFVVYLKHKGVDPYHLDRDGNGVGCEQYGPSTAPSGSTGPTGPTGSHTPTPSTSGTAGALAVTGPSVPIMAGVGGGLLLAGGLGIWAAKRRRRVEFIA